MNAILAKLLIFAYGLSIAGYVLLDGGHEILHAFKNKLHHHEDEHHHRDQNEHSDHHDRHHHIEDHQSAFTPDTDQATESKDPVNIFSFLLFFQTPSALIISGHSIDLYSNELLQNFHSLNRAPLTPPPLG